MNESPFRVEELDNSLLVYEKESYLGEITLFSREIVNKLNELYSYKLLFEKYRRNNDYLVSLLSEAVKQGFAVDLEDILKEINES